MGRSLIPFPPQQHSTCLHMKQGQPIPFYAPDGRSLGFRTLDAAERLVAGGYVRATYGRKKSLRAIWLCQEDGGNPVETQAHAGTRYSFLQKLDNGGHCWKLRRVDGRDDDGLPVSTCGVFIQVVKDCLVA
jgi:hypothetical protein